MGNRDETVRNRTKRELKGDQARDALATAEMMLTLTAQPGAACARSGLLGWVCMAGGLNGMRKKGGNLGLLWIGTGSSA